MWFRDGVSRCYERLGNALDGVEKSELAHLRSAIERIQQMLQVYREFAEPSS
jgi:hypothetical protein